MQHPDSRKCKGWTSTNARVPHFGINRRELDRLLIDAGGSVVSLRRTGEISYRHPLLPQRPKADGRRKDAPASLVHFVRRVIEKIGIAGGISGVIPAAVVTHG